MRDVMYLLRMINVAMRGRGISGRLLGPVLLCPDPCKKMASPSPVQGTAAAPVKKAPRSSLLRSCERCRRRKIRCDDYFPCAACTRLGLQCKLSDDRKAERSQSFLEERVKRLESLLAQHEKRERGASPASRPATPTPSGSMNMSGPSQHHLRLQIPASPSPSPMSPTPEDSLTSPGQDVLDYQIGYVSSYCSSPVDFATSPAGDLPPWSSSDAFNLPEQSSFFDYPRRANSFPSTPGNNYADPSTDFASINFSSMGQGQHDNLMVPEIPTIEVTSWETQSNLSNDGGINDIAFNLPDLSVGSWSGPPSPSLTAVSHGFGNDEYLTDIDLDWRSRRSSVTFSERSFSGFDSLKPDVPLTPAFSHSRPRSRSDVLPQTTRYLHATPHSFHPESSHRQFLNRSDSSDFISGADEASYSRTFFDRIHPYFPILSPQTFQSYANTSTDTTNTDQQTNIQKFEILLVFAIGSRFQSNVGGCHASIPGLYFQRAQQLYPKNIWQQNPSLKTLQEHLLLAIYTLLSTYCPSFLAEGSQGAQNAMNPSIWMLNAFTTASAIDLNLHVRTDLDESEQDTFISVYVLDNVVGMLLGKPNLLRGLNIDIGGMRRVQGTTEMNRMRMDELANEDVGNGWRCVLEWYRTDGRDFVL
ncbi:hypothetical protein DL98DRAFT_577953 [Cadophora sp. DSE1049]|nr:hypothetical protein DL98DRAFT_577953 [Cadophora sp. DSE1049]